MNGSLMIWFVKNWSVMNMSVSKGNPLNDQKPSDWQPALYQCCQFGFFRPNL